MSRKKKDNAATTGLATLAVLVLLGIGWLNTKKSEASENRNAADRTETVQTSAQTEEEKSNQEESAAATFGNADSEGLEVPRNVSMKAPEQLLKRIGYTTSYNKTTRTPNWVGWCLTAAHTDGDNARSNHKFEEDTDVPAPRATYADIRESECGYQRGHICPAGDNKWSYKAQKQAFLMTNICPQNGNLNQKDWKYLEEECRTWAKTYGKVYIVAGPIFRSTNPERVGTNKVAVPDAFFKVVLAPAQGKRKALAIGFVYDNVSGHHKMDYYVRTVDEVEKLTGLDFFYQLPDNVENKIEATASLAAWK